MPFDRCITAAVDEGLIDDDRADEYRELYGEIEAGMRAAMNPQEAAGEAARATFAILERDMAERRRQVFLSLATRQDIERRLEDFVSYWTRERDPYLAATGLYDRLLPNREGFAVEQQAEFWRGQAHAEMDDAFRAYRKDLIGRQGRRADEDNVVAEGFGRDTGDAEARAIAGGWQRAAALLRQARNRYGGHTGELADWGFPTWHSPRLIGAVPFETWRARIWDRINRGRMVDGRTGRPLNDDQLRAALEHMYQAIVTDGWAFREATAGAGRAIANRRAEHRFVHFKSPEDWAAYVREFGQGNVFDAMLHHIDGLSRDVALMQVMGPNPNATLRWVENELTRRAAVSGERRQVNRAKSANNRLKAMHAHYTGSANIPVAALPSELMEDLSNVQTSAWLGSAALIAAPTDLNFSRMTLRFNGLPSVRFLAAYVRLLNPASPEDRLLATRMGLTAQGMAQVVRSEARGIGQMYGHAWSRWLADRTLTYSGLTPHTEAARWGFGWTLHGELADQAGRGWADLDEGLREGLARYRIGEAEWNDIRATPPRVERGVSTINPADIAAREDLDASRGLDLAQRVADWVMTETEFAVPSNSLAARALALGAERPGTLPGAALRSMFKFRNFALTYLMSHGRRLVARTTPAQRLQYAASLFVVNTVLGAFATQMRELSQGRDPRDTTDPRFWMGAVVAGGGLGVFADFVYAGITGVNRQGRTLPEVAAGPTFAFAADVSRAAVGEAQAAFDPDKPSGVPTLEFVKRYMPGGSIWYIRAALERYVYDAIQEEIDPGWQGRRRRLERWYRQQFDQSFFWRRGDQPGFDDSSMRSPDLSAAAGGSSQ